MRVRDGIGFFGIGILILGWPIGVWLEFWPLWLGVILTLPGILTVVAAMMLPRKNVTRLPMPKGAVRPGAGVLLRCAGHHITGGIALDVTFLQAAYATEFLKLNADCAVKVGSWFSIR